MPVTLRRCPVLLSVCLPAILLGVSCLADEPKSGKGAYDSIAPRNAFGLSPEAKSSPVQVAPPEPETAPNIFLTGVAQIKGQKMVYLTVTTPGAKEAKYYRLAESEREGGIEVLGIDLKNGEVQIKDRGHAVKLTFSRNGAAPVASAGAATVAVQTPPVPPPLSTKPMAAPVPK